MERKRQEASPRVQHTRPLKEEKTHKDLKEQSAIVFFASLNKTNPHMFHYT